MDYMSVLGKVLSSIPIAREIPGRFLHGMKIVSPDGTDVVKKGKSPVRGSYTIAPSGDWVVFTETRDRLWPQRDVQFDHLKQTWSAEVYIGSNASTPATIVLGNISTEFRYLIEHYRRVGNEKNYWPGLARPVPSKSLREVFRVHVTVVD